MSNVIIAILTGIFSVLGVLLKLNTTSKYNIDEAEHRKWRKDIRDIAIKISVLDLTTINKQNKSLLEKQLNILKSRINPYGYGHQDYMKDAHLWKNIFNLENEEKRNNSEKTKLTQFLYLLLKYDWERSKILSSFNVFALIGYCIYIISNVLLAFVLYENFQTISINELISFILIFAIIFFVPEINLFLMKNTLTFFTDLLFSYAIPIGIIIFINYKLSIDDITFLQAPSILQIIALIVLFFSKFKFYNNILCYKRAIKKIEKDYQPEKNNYKFSLKNSFINKKYEEQPTMNKIKELSINLIHFSAIIAIMVLIFHTIFCVDTGFTVKNFYEDLIKSIYQASLTEWFNFMGAIAFVLFGINGIYEFCYTNGISFLVPPVYKVAKENMLLKQAETMMHLYYNNDIEFIQKYENERIAKILNLLQLTDKQFHHIRYEILKARVETITDLKTLQNKARPLLLNPENTINLKNVNIPDRVYDNVDYYIDLYTALLDKELCNDVCEIMTNFLHLKIKDKMSDIDCFVVPYGGNLYLATAVAQKMDIRLISILRDSRMLKTQSWDGELPKKKNGEKIKIAILHDVLVSGDRIYKSLEKLPQDSYEVIGIFSLIYYKTTNHNPIETLFEHGISKDLIYNIIEVTDEEMEGIINDSRNN